MTSGNQYWRFAGQLGQDWNHLTCMSSGNQNLRFYLTSSLLGNWDRLEITSPAWPQGTSIGGFIWACWPTGTGLKSPHLHDLREPVLEVCWPTGTGLKSPHLHVLREPELEDLLDLKLAGQTGLKSVKPVPPHLHVLRELELEVLFDFKLTGQLGQTWNHSNLFLLTCMSSGN